MCSDLLVGSTGFVGGNLMAAHDFTAVCHSKDVAARYGTAPDLCVYAGVPAAMFLANADPEADLAVMAAARENLRRIAPKELVLISSIAVYADSRGKNEDDEPGTENLSAYGRNRLQLERWVREDFPEALIVRLPALYGKGLKKNFLYDLRTITPSMLKPEKYEELSRKSALVRDGYTLADNGFYKLNGTVDAGALRAFFAGNDFNALAFTDSRSRYQFYNLGRLWQDICTAREAGLRLLHLCTPPIPAETVYTAVTGKTDWHNELPKAPFDYDLHSKYAGLLGGSGNYLCTEAQELDDIRNFLQPGKERDDARM
ncbi:sugar nucleotide-binding protein [uncultured Subdoligranulum sp.]|uniref:sugar nucleotide-binding protein n=1 Tax=uncultured Subdoligranulum sp. TaxID=512298 RepID=UPI00320B9557